MGSLPKLPANYRQTQFPSLAGLPPGGVLSYTEIHEQGVYGVADMQEKNTHVIQSESDHSAICGEISRKDVPSPPAGDRILC
jgi:hypothetical protein